MTRARLATLGLALAAILLHGLVPRPDPDAALAERLLGPAERLDLPGPPAYRAGERAVLFFERRGMEGGVRGAVVLDRGTIAEVVLLGGREGMDGRALEEPAFWQAFRGRQAEPPVLVEAISGATVSSQAVIDAVNDRLMQWRTRFP